MRGKTENREGESDKMVRGREVRQRRERVREERVRVKELK